MCFFPGDPLSSRSPDPGRLGSLPARRERGFSLIEAIVAIAIIGSAIMISAALLNTLIISADHLQTQEQLLSEIESAVEMMRAGILPLKSGPLVTGGDPKLTPGLSVTVIVEEDQNLNGLYRVSFRAECSFRRRRISQSLLTEIWRP